MNNYLFDRLDEYCSSDAYPFHMPGHKRNTELLKGLMDKIPYEIDITEIDGFDNLHHAEGILKDAQRRAAKLYGAAESFYLINGSTCGILAAIFACTKQRGKLLMARNCHKAVYHAVELRELETVYLYPEEYKNAEKFTSDIWTGRTQINGVIAPQDVETALKEDSDIQAVMITSPTYDGIVSDVKEIAKIVHQYGLPLIVDEAHGAHFGFHPYFPENSLKKGADIVIHSLHKTLPSLTQTALLHIGEKSTKWTDSVKKYLDIFETSSPSYVMMAGMDQCIRLLEKEGSALFEDYARRLKNFRKTTEHLSGVHILPCIDSKRSDPGKLVIAADGMNGQQLAEKLRKDAHIEVEMAAAGYVIALTSIADTDEGFERLKNALIHISEIVSTSFVEITENKNSVKPKFRLQRIYSIAQASSCRHRTVKIENAKGHVCGEYIYLYPPGIPLAVPGEKISQELINDIYEKQRNGMEIQGLRDYSGKHVDVCEKEGKCIL